jgi:hypothetical protein
LNLGVSRNRFCDFLADPDSRSFSRFGAIIMQFAATPVLEAAVLAKRSSSELALERCRLTCLCQHL